MNVQIQATALVTAMLFVITLLAAIYARVWVALLEMEQPALVSLW